VGGVPEEQAATSREGWDWAAFRVAPTAPDIADATLRQLGPVPAAARGRPIDEVFAAAYARLTRAAERRAFQAD